MNKIDLEIRQRIQNLKDWGENHRQEIREEIYWTGKANSVFDEIQFLENLLDIIERS